MKKNQALVRIAGTFVLAMALFTITACSHDGETDDDIVPPTPSNLQRIGATSNSVTIGWTSVVRAVSYKVYRCAIPSGQYICMNETGTPDLRYTDSGLSSGLTFYYKVSAVGSEGFESSPSAYVETRTETGASAPALIWVPDTTKDSITITWTPVSGAIEYEIWWCLTPEGQYDLLGKKAAPPYIHEGLPPATSSYYKIKSLGNNGVSSGFSNSAKGTTKQADGNLAAGDDNTAPLAAPAGLQVTSTTDSAISLVWNAVSGATAYAIYQGSSSGSVNDFVGTTTSSTSYTVSRLSGDTLYYFTVRSMNGQMPSAPSAEVSARTNAGLSTAPSAPGTPIVSPGNGQLTVSWPAVSGAASYEVWYGTTNNTSGAQYGVDITGLSATISGLTNNTMYYVWVKAKNAVGTSAFSPGASGTPGALIAAPPAPVAPQAPAAPVVTAGDGQLTVNWTAVTGATAYEVWYGTTNNSVSAAKYGADVTGLTATISSLTNGTPYYVWAKAKNAAGTSGFSPSTSGTPLASVVAPPASAALSSPAAPVVTAGDGQLTVSWTAVTGATAYEVWTGTANDSASAAKYGADVTGLTATISSLTNGTPYYVWAKAKNAAGTSGFSPSTSGTPLASVVAPPAPTAPVVTAGDGQLTVSWTAVTGATSYKVFRSASSDGTYSEIGTATSNSYTDSGLAAGTTYYYKVSAVNSGGESGQSGYTSATTTSPSLPTSGTLAERLAWLSSHATSGGDYTIELTANETIAPATLSYSGKTVKITLKGDTAERTVSLGSTGSLFTVHSGVTLTLDNNVTLQGRSNNTASLVQVNSGGTLAMKGNAKITGNTASDGGGVNVSGGSFIMSGNASVSGNTAAFAGGVEISSSSFTMSGNATVSGNTASVSGGGVFVGQGDASFTMSGNASVSGNTADSGGGVCVYANSTFTMSDSASVSNNTATNAGGVMVQQNGSSFTMSGNATVSGNTVSNGVYQANGGGVSVAYGSFTLSGSAAVSGNTATSGGGGVYVSSNTYSTSSDGGSVYLTSSFIMSGGAVSGNTSTFGGGVYVNGDFTKTGGIIYGSNETNPTLRNTVTGQTNSGAAVYEDDTHRRETTVGAAQNLSASGPYSQRTFTGQWDD